MRLRVLALVVEVDLARQRGHDPAGDGVVEIPLGVADRGHRLTDREIA
jgi:hypothetical protein